MPRYCHHLRTDDENENGNKMTEDGDDGDDTTSRYLMCIKVAERKLLNNVPTTNLVLVSQINPKLQFKTMIPLILYSFVPIALMAASVEDAKSQQSSDATGKSN